MKIEFELHIYWSDGAARVFRGRSKKECLREAAAFSYHRCRWYKNGKFLKEEKGNSV